MKIKKFLKETKEQLNQLIAERMTASFIRRGGELTEDMIFTCLKHDAAKFHKLPTGMITDDMIIKSIEVYEKRVKSGEKVNSYAEVLFLRHFKDALKKDHKAKVEQLNHLRAKVDLFVVMQDNDEGHDFLTNFSEGVCFYTLHSMVYSNWLKYVEPVMNLTLMDNINHHFTQWVDSPESDYFVVSCWIALAEAQKAIETPRDEDVEPLHYTTHDIKRYAAIVELDVVQDEIKRHEGDIKDLEDQLGDFDTLKNRLDFHTSHVADLVTRSSKLQEQAKEAA